VGESFLRKTLALRSFQISYTISNVSEDNPLRLLDAPSTKRDNQSDRLTRVNLDNVLDERLRIGGRGRQMNSKVKDQTNKAKLVMFIETKLKLQA
jgi:hypothetical protein